MEFFIGIALPTQIKDIIDSFQRSFAHNQVPDRVEPHITVKSQGGLIENMEWLSRIEQVAQITAPFTLSFDGAGSFENNVIFLNPATSTELLLLHRNLLAAVGPYKDPTHRYFEGDQYHPHLTLGGMKWGLAQEEAITMRQRAQQELNRIPPFGVDAVRIYKKDTEHSTWSPMLDISFGK